MGVCYVDFVGCDFDLDLLSLVGFAFGFACWAGDCCDDLVDWFAASP